MPVQAFWQLQVGAIDMGRKRRHTYIHTQVQKNIGRRRCSHQKHHKPFMSNDKESKEDTELFLKNTSLYMYLLYRHYYSLISCDKAFITLSDNYLVLSISPLFILRLLFSYIFIYSSFGVTSNFSFLLLYFKVLF